MNPVRALLCGINLILIAKIFLSDRKILFRSGIRKENKKTIPTQK